MSELIEKPAARPLIKICGLTRPEDAAYCAELGINMVGFIFHPQSPRRLSPAKAAALDTGLAVRVGVFGPDVSPAQTKAIMAEARLDLAQLHADQDEDFCRRLGPDKIMRVFWPQRYQAPELLAAELNRFHHLARLFLLDAGQLGGGHGQALDLDFLRLTAVPTPWLLAGGLNAARLGELKNQPALSGLCGFDFNSGVESAPGQKNSALIQAVWAEAEGLRGRFPGWSVRAFSGKSSNVPRNKKER